MILDVRFYRDAVSCGGSGTFDPDDGLLLAALHAFARWLHRKTGEPTAPLVGTVRRPRAAIYLGRLERELDACDGAHIAHLQNGGALSVSSLPLLVVVLQGCGVLRGQELSRGSLALLPAEVSDALQAGDLGLELLTLPLG